MYFLRQSQHAAAKSIVKRLSALLFALYCLCNVEALARDAQCAPRIREPRAVPVAMADEVTVATQNLKHFFDDVDDGDGMPVSAAEFERRLDKLSSQVGQVLRRPDVLAVQEVENEKVLAALAAALAKKNPGQPYRPLAPEGFDYSGIDVGFLVRSDWEVLGMEQLFRRHRLKRAALFDRPPLLLTLRTTQGMTLDIVNVHLKSLYGSGKNASEARRIAYKRKRQTVVLEGWLRERLQQRPHSRLLLLGDFNATPDVLGGVDVLGMLQGAGMINLLDRLPPAERYSFVYKCRGEALDHILVSPALLPSVRRLAVSRGNAGVVGRFEDRRESPMDSSDHDGVVVYLER